MIDGSGLARACAVSATALAALILATSFHDADNEQLVQLSLALTVLPALVAALTLGRLGALVGIGTTIGMLTVFRVEGYYAGPVLLAAAVVAGIAAVVAGETVEHYRRRLARLGGRSEPELRVAVMPDGRLTESSLSDMERRGYGPRASIDTDLAAYVHPDERQRLALLLLSVTLREPSRRAGFRMHQPGGEFRWFDITMTHDANQKTTTVVGWDVHNVVGRAADSTTADLVAYNAELQASVSDLTMARRDLLHSLELASAFRDDDPYGHTARIGRSSAAVARALGLGCDAVRLLEEAAPLHDLGMISVADDQRGRGPGGDYSRSAEVHTVAGSTILEKSEVPVLKLAASIALFHHERWDGAGFPCGYAGDRIPLAARIVAVADRFDLLTHPNGRSSPHTATEALESIRRESGSRFDPDVVEALARLVASDALDASPSTTRRSQLHLVTASQG